MRWRPLGRELLTGRCGAKGKPLVRSSRWFGRTGSIKRMRQVFGAIGVVAIIAAMAIAIAFWSGWYNVAASAPHAGPVSRLLQTAMARSVREHSGSALPKGADLRDRALAAKAADDYREMCLLCHGAPGKKAAFWTAGLYPAAPPLSDSRELRWSDADLYWIIKNDVKDTAMPPFGATHNESELLALAALARQLPAMTPNEFDAMGQKSK